MAKNIVGAPILCLSILSLTACPTPTPPCTPDKGDLVVLPQNGSLFSAVQLGRGVCTAAVTKIPGRLASPDDADLFALPVNSGCSLPFLSPYDPLDWRTQLPKLTVNVGDVETEACFFGSCDYGKTVRQDCRNGGYAAHLEEGMLGCCIKGPGTFLTGISCDSYSPSISGFVLVKSVGNDPHADYEIDFSISEP
jgi:hypothetical protein